MPERPAPPTRDDEIAAVAVRVGSQVQDAGGRDFPVLDREDVRDAFADAVLAALERCRGATEAEIAGYIFRAARSGMVDRVRRRTRRGEASLFDEDGEPLAVAAPEGDPAEVAQRGADRAMVRDALAQVPPPTARVLWCDFYAGLRPREARVVLGMSEREYEGRRRRGLRRLGAELTGLAA